MVLIIKDYKSVSEILPNSLVLGDCVEVMKLIPDESVDLIIIDPPYLVTKEKWDKKEVVNQQLSSELFRIAKPNCSLYVWCGIGEKSQSLIRWFPIFSEQWYFKDLITWKKQRGMGMRKGWLYTREELTWFVKDNKKFIWNKENQYGTQKRTESGFKKADIERTGRDVLRHTNIWIDITEVSLGNNGVLRYTNIDKKKLHFTPKPEKAIERIVLVHTKENDVVLDCFLGSGTTAKVAKNLNRQFIGIELDENYFDIAVKRLESSDG